MKVGLVCPYTWDVPGGVQAHVRDLAETLIEMGHDVSVATPADDEADLPAYVVSTGQAVPVRYNGSTARLAFGPVSGRRVRRWLREGGFDVLHLHEPFAPSIPIVALWLAKDEPIVATFHASVDRSRMLQAVEGALRPSMEKIRGRIAVSDAARRYVVTHLDTDPWIVPNGVRVEHFARAEPLPGWPGDGGAIGFLGRLDEPRKGLGVLLDAYTQLAAQRPQLRLLVAGPGDVDDAFGELPREPRARVTVLGRVSEADKARMLRSVDVYCAPNTGGESFGIILLEAMAAGAPVVASDLDGFRRVLEGGAAGLLVPPEDPAALAAAIGALLDDPPRRHAYAAHGAAVVRRYDWTAVAREILAVYETVVG